MKIGKPYWAMRIRNDALRQSVPMIEYKQARKEMQAAAAKILGNRFEYATEKQALAAKNKLPKEMHEWVEIAESYPVSLGLGWC